MDKKMDKNEKTVQAIVETMKKYASGEYFLHNGELFPIDERDFANIPGCTIQQESVLDEVHAFYVMPGGEAIFEGDLEVATIGDYFDDFYDIDYVIGSDKHYKACRVLVAYGGPNIYIDTWEKQVQLFWWSDTATVDIPDELCVAIDEFFEAIYNC